MDTSVLLLLIPVVIIAMFAQLIVSSLKKKPNDPTPPSARLQAMQKAGWLKDQLATSPSFLACELQLHQEDCAIGFDQANNQVVIAHKRPVKHEHTVTGYDVDLKTVELERVTMNFNPANEWERSPTIVFSKKTDGSRCASIAMQLSREDEMHAFAQAVQGSLASQASTT